MYLHAQRNLRERILADHTTALGGSRSLEVGGSRYARVEKDDTTVTAGEHRHTVSGLATERYRGGYVLRVGEAPKGDQAPPGMAIDVNAGGYTLRSTEPIILSCGESRLELHPERIVLRSPRIAAEGPRASLVLDGDAATMRANKKVELGADVLVAVSTSMSVLKGPNLELGGVNVRIEGENVVVDESRRIDLRTPNGADVRKEEVVENDG